MLSKVLLYYYNTEKVKDRENEKVGDRQLEREIKDKAEIFLLEDQHENFVAALRK